jgi:hypothetical protein
VQLLRVQGNLLKRVDPAKPNGQLLGTELLDGLGEALGQLAALVESERAGAEVEGAEQGQATQALEDRRAQVLNSFQPVGTAEAPRIDRELGQIDDHRQQDGEEYEHADDAGHRRPVRDG